MRMNIYSLITFTVLFAWKGELRIAQVGLHKTLVTFYDILWSVSTSYILFCPSWNDIYFSCDYWKEHTWLSPWLKPGTLSHSWAGM